MASEQGKHELQALLSALRAIRMSHHTAHWQVKGTPFYGDHLMFQRLYEAVDDEIDTLGEKIVAKYGVDAVDAVESCDRMCKLLEQVQGDDLYERAAKLERVLQHLLEGTLKALADGKCLTPGLENFLQGIADSHETAVYLLGQRTAGDSAGE